MSNTRESVQLLGKKGAVAAGRKGAAAVGMKILKEGGNAVDAGVATVLALSVTDRDLFCFGGEVPMLISPTETREVVAVSGQGLAPKKATLEFFKSTGGIPDTGILPAAVPGALSACLLALDKYGTMRFSQVAQPTVDLLDNSSDEEWYPRLARTVRRLVAEESAHSSEGRSAALDAVHNYFYDGPIGKELVLWCRERGGLLSEDDLRTYHATTEEPVCSTCREYGIYKCGFWTQGPAMLQTLNILEGYNLSEMKPMNADYIHLVIEAMKLAFADRDTYYGDPDFVDVPTETLLSKEYAAERRGLISNDTASLEQRPGDAWKNRPILEPEGKQAESCDTTTCAVADRFGNMFVATPSGWGSGVPPGSTGVVLGTRLQSFNTWKGHPNAIEPGKRPRITLTPTLIKKDGEPFMVVSVAGGDQQDQTALQLVLSVTEFGLFPQQAADATRFGTNHLIGSFRQPPIDPGSLTIENTAPKDTVEALRAKGHRVQLVEQLASQAVLIVWHEDGCLELGGDVRKGRELLAWA